MSLWSSATITRFQNATEEFFARECPCIIKRVALDIVSGTSEYTLSDDVISIRRITWKGKKLTPVSQREYRETPYPVSSTGVPTDYIYNNLGSCKIKLYPTPSENIATTSSNLFDSSIATKCIVEYWAAPDFSIYIIPSYFRRRFLKAGALKDAFSIEGRGKNLKNAKYYKGLFEKLFEDYSTTLYSLWSKPRRIIVGDLDSRYVGVPRPVLPPEYGESVDDI